MVPLMAWPMVAVECRIAFFQRNDCARRACFMRVDSVFRGPASAASTDSSSAFA